MMRKCNLGGSTRGIVLAVTFLLLSLQQCQAQVIEVGKDSKMYIDAADFVANQIPTIGPYLSLFGKTLFVAESDPGYKVMQKEWEGYTDKQLSAKALGDRRKLLLGYYYLVKELEDLNFDNDADRLKVWMHLEKDITREINQFSSDDGQAAPGLRYYAGACHLHIDCIDNILMYAALGEESVRVDDYRRRRIKLTSEYNKALNAEIEKAAAEQRSRFTVKVLKNHGTVDNSGTDSDGNRFIKFDLVDMYELLDKGRRSELKSDRGSVNRDQKNLADGAEKNFNAKFKPLFKIEEGCKLYATAAYSRYPIVPGSEEALSKVCGGDVLKVEIRGLPNIEPGETRWGTTARWDEPPRKFDVQAVITMKYRSDALRLNKLTFVADAFSQPHEKNHNFKTFFAGDALVSFRLVPKLVKLSGAFGG
ncbi:MAG: hypothetical protein ACI87E_004200 [Mariniblastus sp.]|jgi:hypothetical protein